MVVHAYYPLAEPRVQREARAARDAGFDVTVLALRGPGEAARERVDGISVRRFPLRHTRGAGLLRIGYEYLGFCALATLWLAVRAWRGRLHVVHVHNPPDFLIIAGLLPRIRGARLVLDIHDLSSDIFSVRVRGRAGRVAERILVWVERLACHLADAVITVHEPYRTELARRGTPAAKIRVVMNSLDEHLLERAQDATSIAGPPGGFRISYHGTLTWWYGVDLLLDALARLRREGIDAEALVLGDGDSVPELMERARRPDLKDHVLLPGRYLPIEATLASVRGAACGVIPNRPSRINRFALSSKLFEYIALGIPVVVSRLETLAAHFGEDEVTFFEPGDAAALSNALRWVHDHPGEADLKARAARIRAQSYSWSLQSETLRRVYRELLTGRPSPECSSGREERPR